MIRTTGFVAAWAMAFAASFASAHGGHTDGAHDVPRAVVARNVTLDGVARSITVTDATSGATRRFIALETSSGERYLLRGITAAGMTPGSAYHVSGGAELATLDVASATRDDRGSIKSAAAPAALEVSGTLRLGHADNFDGGASRFFYSVVAPDGSMTELVLLQGIDALSNGMKVAVTGTFLGDGQMFADRVIILERPAAGGASDMLAAAVTNKVLVIPIKFPSNKVTPYTYNADPFTTASISTAVFGASPTQSVAEYYRDVSFGGHLLDGTVANVGGAWLKANGIVPLDANNNKQCDINVIATLAEAAATAAGYTVASYTNLVYLFESAPFNCGWAGLAYVGWGRAYIKQTTSLLVIGHEIGHNYGLLHAASLDCGATVITAPCTASEYGDPFDVMGNNRAMHFNAFQKNYLGWIATGSVYNHTAGTATYTISPIEAGGASRYAVQVKANRYRSYWIEFRQPLGFDAGLSAFPVNGAQIHVASPFETICSGCGDDTEYLDMTPATSAFTDGALLPGQTFSDEYGVSITVVSATASALTVTVTAPARPSFVDVPVDYAAYLPIETLRWNQVTNGCSANPPMFCPEQMVTRAQMAMFMEREKRGFNYKYSPTGKFSDVPKDNPAAGPVEQFYADGIDPGCGTNPLRFCPDDLVTRASMSMMLVKGRYGGSYTPPAATGKVFTDVPASHPQAAWIEMLYKMGVTNGCTATTYCPDLTVTRAQMAMFFQREFSLPTPP